MKVPELDAGRPIYPQVASWLRAECRGGREGDRFHSQRGLAKAFGIAINTAARALKEIEREGLLERQPGRDPVIRKPALAGEVAKENRPFSVALLHPSSHSFHHWVLKNQLALALQERGCALEALEATGDDSTRDLMRKIGRVDRRAVIVIPHEALAKVLFIRSLAGFGKPVAVLYPKLDSIRGVHWVSPDYRTNTWLMTKHLVEMGHRRVGLICAEAGSHLARVRSEGFRRALEEAGLPVYEEDMARPRRFLFRDNQREGYELMCERLRRTAAGPTGWVFDSDGAAMGGLCALWEKGISVPKDVSVISEGNIPGGAFAIPPLTTCGHDIPALVKALMTAILTDVREPPARHGGRGKPSSSQGVSRKDEWMVPGNLVERRSVSKPGGHRP